MNVIAKLRELQLWKHRHEIQLCKALQTIVALRMSATFVTVSV